eukprot:6415764-Amphidinium_carterae.1
MLPLGVRITVSASVKLDWRADQKSSHHNAVFKTHILLRSTATVRTWTFWSTCTKLQVAWMDIVATSMATIRSPV